MQRAIKNSEADEVNVNLKVIQSLYQTYCMYSEILGISLSGAIRMAMVQAMPALDQQCQLFLHNKENAASPVKDTTITALQNELERLFEKIKGKKTHIENVLKALEAKKAPTPSVASPETVKQSPPAPTSILPSDPAMATLSDKTIEDIVKDL